MAVDWLSIGTSVAGGIAGFLGNKSAAKTQKKALKLMEEQAAIARADRERGRKAALGLISPDFNQDAADNDIRNRITTRPDLMTDSQRIGLEDLTRRNLNNQKAQGLSGSGRAGAAVLADSTRRYLAGAKDVNQQRSDSAADYFARRGESARTSGANIETGVTGAMATDANSLGANLYAATNDSAAPNLANAQLIGSTLGAISGIVRSDRNYDKYKAVPAVE